MYYQDHFYFFLKTATFISLKYLFQGKLISFKSKLHEHKVFTLCPQGVKTRKTLSFSLLRSLVAIFCPCNIHQLVFTFSYSFHLSHSVGKRQVAHCCPVIDPECKSTLLV